MKLPMKVLCVALLALLATTGVAQSVKGSSRDSDFVTTPTPPPADVIPGTLTIHESASGWLLSFTSMGTTETLVLFVGTASAPSTMSFGLLGTLGLDIDGIVSVVAAGVTSRRGDAVVSLERPKTLDPSLEGIIMWFQGASVDYRGATSVTDVTVSNPSKIELISGDRL